MLPLRERPRGGIAPPVIGLVKARAVKVERQLLRLDRVRAADDVILLTVGIICADVFSASREIWSPPAIVGAVPS